MSGETYRQDARTGVRFPSPPLGPKKVNTIMTVTTESSTSLRDHAQTHRSLRSYHQANAAGKQTLGVLSRNRDILRDTLLEVKNGSYDRDLALLVTRAQMCKEIDLSQFSMAISQRSFPGLSAAQVNSMNLENRRLTEKLTAVMNEITKLLDFMAEIADLPVEKRSTNAWKKKMAVVLNSTFE